jgi:CrcB protein
VDDDLRHIPIDPDLDPADPAQPAVGRPPGFRPSHLRRTAPDVLAAIALGGMVGASGRYGMGRWLPTTPDRFPWATFWTNLAGSFLLGLLLVLLLEHLPPTRLLRPFLTTGILGAFTTMSTFQVETALLLDHDHPSTAAAYLGASLVAGVALAWAGVRTAHRVGPRVGPSLA